MRARDLMTTNVQICHEDEPLSTAAKIMWDSDCGCVPVVDADSRLVGMITDRDLCMAALLQGKRLDEIPISSAMSNEVKACRPEENLSAVQATMRSNRVRRVPVASPDGSVVGIISLNDLALAASRRSAGREVASAEVLETFATICEHQGRAATRA